MNATETEHTQPLRTALIGGGINSAVGRVHDIALRMDHHYRLMAGSFSRDPEINEASGHAYGLAHERVYSSYEALLANEYDNLDVVCIALPTKDHARAIEAALDRGLKVITDKPTVANVAEAERLVQRLGPDTQELFTLFNYTGYPLVRDMRHRIAQGELGRVFRLMIEMPQDSFLRARNQKTTNQIQSWRLKDGDICGLSLDLFTHIHSLALYLTGAHPTNAHANLRSISQASPGLIDDADALIEYDNDMLLNAWYGKAALGYRNGLRLRVFGTEGSFEWLQAHPEQLIWADGQGETHLKDRQSPDSSLFNNTSYNRFKAGHPAGFIEAFANVYTDIAQAINQPNPELQNLLTLGDATEGLQLAQMLENHTKKKEVNL